MSTMRDRVFVNPFLPVPLSDRAKSIGYVLSSFLAKSNNKHSNITIPLFNIDFESCLNREKTKGVD